jgi:hypothetical protein
MIKSLLIAAALAFSATANAQVATPYVEATASTNQIKTLPRNVGDLGYGLRVGVEAPINSRATVTLDGGVENFLKGSDDLTLTANVGLNGKLAGPFGVYGQAGVLQTAGDTGYRLGGGLRLDLLKNAYLRAGLQRDDYGNDRDSIGGTVGLGIRF